MKAFLNNRFISASDATLNVSDLAIQRGYGVFDFFRIRNGAPLYLPDYLDRFFLSAEFMRLDCPVGREELSAKIHELVAMNGMSDAGMKMILTGGYAPDAYTPVQGNLIITQHPLTLPSADQVNKGIKIITHEYRRDLPEVKTINYAMGIWLQKKVADAQAADVLYHLNGEVSEFPRCNFFAIAGGKLITPDRHILKGITRMKVLEVARKKFPVEERSLTLAEVFGADEMFLTSTTKGILPIVKVDEKVVGDGKPGRMTLELRGMLREREENSVAVSR